MRITAGERTEDKLARGLERRRFQEKQITPLPSDNVERALKALNVICGEGDDRHVARPEVHPAF